MFCSNCARPIDEADRFCQSCGAPVMRDPPPPPPPPPPAAAAVPAAAAPPPPQSAPRRRPAAILTAGAGVIALIVVVALLATGLGGASGGADDAVSAVQQLAAAARAEDPSAAIAILHPDEAQSLDEVFETVRTRVAGTGAIRSDGGIAGAELSIEGLELTPVQLGPGVVKVMISGGRYSARLKAAELPSILRPAQDSNHEADLGESRAGNDVGLFVVAREHDGSWFLSPAFTALQYLVEIEELPDPDFSAPQEQAGEAGAPKDPSQLMSRLAQAVSDRSVDGMLDLVSVREAGSLRPYRAALETLVGKLEGAFAVDVRSSSFQEQDAGAGLVRLDLSRIALHGTLTPGYGESEFDVTLTGFCGTLSSSGSDGSQTERDCDTQIRRAFGIERPFLIAEREGDELRIAPLATLLAYLRVLSDRLGNAGAARMLGLVTRDKPSATLASGARREGRLNDGGFAVHGYEGAAKEFLAVDSDQETLVIGSDGRQTPALACTNGSKLYRLGPAGLNKIVVVGGELRSDAYRVVAERVTPRKTAVPSRVSGSVGSAARMAVFMLDAPQGGTTFESGDSISASFAGPLEGDADDCYPSTEELFGPYALFNQSKLDDPEPPSSAGANTSIGDYEESGTYVLAVVGAAGTTFGGRLSKTAAFVP